MKSVFYPVKKKLMLSRKNVSEVSKTPRLVIENEKNDVYFLWAYKVLVSVANYKELTD